MCQCSFSVMEKIILWEKSNPSILLDTFCPNLSALILKSYKATWKTVSIAIEKESKLEAGVPNSKLKVPPKSCIPRSAKIRMNKNRRRRSDTMDFSEAKRDTTKFLRDDQYLSRKKNQRWEIVQCDLKLLLSRLSYFCVSTSVHQILNFVCFPQKISLKGTDFLTSCHNNP